ncbi:fe2+ zn2+ uptake regulation protein [Pseudomonas putida]|nr:fe2+ zn2+ uptake regulation protein [Pseudomonas putida]
MPDKASVPRAFGCSSVNQFIHELLRQCGLRSSLFRLKVIDALFVAASEGHLLGVHEVHARFAHMDVTLVSVREVLRRLKDVGLIICNAEGGYTLSTEAYDILMKRYL